MSAGSWGGNPDHGEQSRRPSPNRTEGRAVSDPYHNCPSSKFSTQLSERFKADGTGIAGAVPSENRGGAQAAVLWKASLGRCATGETRQEWHASAHVRKVGHAQRQENKQAKGRRNAGDAEVRWQVEATKSAALNPLTPHPPTRPPHRASKVSDFGVPLRGQEDIARVEVPAPPARG